LGLRGPDDGTRALVESHELAVELADVDTAVPQSHPAAQPAAAHGVDGFVELRLVGPESLSGVDADGEHVVGARDDVDHAVVHDRLRLPGVLAGKTGAFQAHAPVRLQVRDVAAIDLRQG